MQRTDIWIDIFNRQFIEGYAEGYDHCLRLNSLGKYAVRPDGSMECEHPEEEKPWEPSSDEEIWQYLEGYAEKIRRLSEQAGLKQKRSDTDESLEFVDTEIQSPVFRGFYAGL